LTRDKGGKKKTLARPRRTAWWKAKEIPGPRRADPQGRGKGTGKEKGGALKVDNEKTQKAMPGKEGKGKHGSGKSEPVKANANGQGHQATLGDSPQGTPREEGEGKRKKGRQMVSFTETRRKGGQERLVM